MEEIKNHSSYRLVQTSDTSFDIVKVIRHEPDKNSAKPWRIYSESGKFLGGYKTKREAANQLRNIEGHKKG